MVKQNLDAIAHALREGTITESAFLKGSDETWRRVATRLWNRWRRKLPSWVEFEDVYQEVRMLALAHVRKWEAGRGGIGAFVVWSTTMRSQRVIHGWRGAVLSGNEGRNPSRAEVAFARAYPTDPLGTRVPGTVGPSAEEAVESAEAFDDVLGSCRTATEAIVLHALRSSGGAVRSAAQAIYADFAVRIELGVSGPRQAEKVVRRTLAAVVGRYQDEVEQDAVRALLSQSAA